MASRNPGHSTPQLQHIHQQNAEKEQQRDGPEQEPHEVRLTLLIPPCETMVGDESGNDEKNNIQGHDSGRCPATAVILTARAKSAASYSTKVNR